MTETPLKKQGIAVFPTLLTLGNGFCGFLAIAKTTDAFLAPGGEGFSGKVIQAAWLIFLGMIFDALDGRVARLTNQTSEFGIQLDSITDTVSFAVAPALLAKVVYEHALTLAGIPFSVKLTLLLSSLYLLCAILRLARFSLKAEKEDTSHNVFSGLPTPAAAGLIASSVLFFFEGGESLGLSMDKNTTLTLQRMFIFLPPFLGVLMISKIEYIHLVSRYVRGRKTYDYLAMMIVTIFLIAFCHDWAIMLFFMGYVLSGPVLALWKIVKQRSLPWQS